MSHSTVRLLCHPHHQRVGDHRATSDPVLWADLMTTMADCRIAINVERGIPLDLIDPALGCRRAGS